jgi:hypothetical protein
MRTATQYIAITALAAATVSCGDVVREGRSPVIMTVASLTAGNPASNILHSDVIRNVTAPPPCSTTSPCPTVFNDSATASLALSMKNTTVSPTTNNQVQVTRYHVDYTRADGRNTPGVDVPYGFDGAATVTIPPNGVQSVSFDLVRHSAKEESPLAQLVNSSNFISTIATVTFFGTDTVGNVVSASAQISVTFANYGDQ